MKNNKIIDIEDVRLKTLQMEISALSKKVCLKLSKSNLQLLGRLYWIKETGKMDKTIFESLKRGLKQAEEYKSGKRHLHPYNAKIKIPDVRAIRQKTGLTQEEFGRLFGWCKDTVASWEQKRRAPEHSARVMLKIMECIMTDEEPTGKAKGGKARSAVLTPDQRKEIAQKGAEARWSKAKEIMPQETSAIAAVEHDALPKAVAEGELTVGDETLSCAVLDDANNTRILTQNGFLKAIGRHPFATGGTGGAIDGSAPFLRAKNLEPFISEDLKRSTAPIIPLTPQNHMLETSRQGSVNETLASLQDISSCELTDAALMAGVEAYFEWERLGGLEHGFLNPLDLARMIYVSILGEQRKASSSNRWDEADMAKAEIVLQRYEKVRDE